MVNRPYDSQNPVTGFTRLFPNYPNPFNCTTTFRFVLKENSRMTLKVYNIEGRLVAILDRGMRKAGEHSLTWYVPESLSSGLYFCRLQAGRFSGTQKLLLQK
ncbi:T9SS type A sorting domain-containing protein [candidate division KSB1 bacterium]|nr:T9SS type A sorting domain-containing protein [candidate division KSB1 bacterium]